MQEVSMAAWRQSILIGLQGGHACIEVRLRRRGAGNVQRVRGARRRVHTSWGFSGPSTQTAGCFTRNMFLDCMILLHLGPCSSAACVEAPLSVDRSCFAQSACAAVNLLGRLQGCSPRICRAHAASAPSGTEHPPRTSAPRPCAEGGRARLPVLAAPFDAAWWQQRSVARADLACWRGPTRAPKAPGSARRRRSAWRGWG